MKLKEYLARPHRECSFGVLLFYFCLLKICGVWFFSFNVLDLVNSLVVQWLGLCDFTAVGSGFDSWLETKILQAMPGSKKQKKKIWI